MSLHHAQGRFVSSALPTCATRIETVSNFPSNYRIKLVASDGKSIGFLGPLANNGDVPIVALRTEALIVTVPTRTDPESSIELKLVPNTVPDQYLGAELTRGPGQERWSFRALTSGAEIDDQNVIVTLTFIWNVTNGTKREIQAVWTNQKSLAAVTSMGGAPLTVWMHSAKEALGPNQQVLKMILEPEEYVPPNTLEIEWDTCGIPWTTSLWHVVP
ncbi:hypothetical protein FRB95_014174 [Tulasnella sp. JGI-2019a]|nr:hypothetical protein FRB95_014174 [Tulasnella sp. JGI-2019a]